MKLLTLLLILGLVLSCSETQKTDQMVDDSGIKAPSELAQLMRVMEAYADACRQAIRKGEGLPDAPMGIEGLVTARPTMGMHIDQQTFPVFAKDYQAKIEALYAAQDMDRESAYNAVIQSCTNCHLSHCPGPLMKINKMSITESR